MAGRRDPHRDGWRDAAAVAAGVTRVARLTGLDRTGVEVASAIRPLGHVLQVTNGKGTRFEDARRGALMEAAELCAAERAAAEAWGSARELRARLGEDALVAPAELDPALDAPASEALRLAWRAGEDLLGGERVLVPAHAVHVPPAGAAALGPAVLRWTSNGMGASPRRDGALLHALLEAIERDQLARALPDGFARRELTRRLLAPGTLPRAAPRAAALAASLAGRGFAVHLLDAAPHAPRAGAGRPGGASISRRRPDARALGLPVAAAVLVDHEHGPVPVAAGYACRLGRDEALLAALLEAAQSRATEIHGAREDVEPGDRRAALGLARACAEVRARRGAARMPDVRSRTPAKDVALVLDRLRRAGYRRVVAIDLDGPPGIAVVKVIVPGLLLSDLL